MFSSSSNSNSPPPSSPSSSSSSSSEYANISFCRFASAMAFLLSFRSFLVFITNVEVLSASFTLPMSSISIEKSSSFAANSANQIERHAFRNSFARFSLRLFSLSVSSLSPLEASTYLSTQNSHCALSNFVIVSQCKSTIFVNFLSSILSALFSSIILSSLVNCCE